jgi:hypothetical protein
MVTAMQLDRKLASAQHPSPPQDPAALAVWHHNNGLALPDHLQTESGPTPQGTRPAVKPTPANTAGAP